MKLIHRKTNLELQIMGPVVGLDACIILQLNSIGFDVYEEKSDPAHKVISYKELYDDLFEETGERETELWKIINMLHESVDRERKEVMRLIETLAERRDIEALAERRD